MQYYLSTAWLVFWFWGFHNLHQNMTRALYGWFLGFGDFDYRQYYLEHCMAGFWVFMVLRVLQSTPRHRQYYLSTAWLIFGFLGFSGIYNLHKVTDNITWALHGWFLGFWGFDGFIDYIKSQTILLEYCMAGFWVFRVLRVLQPTSSHRQYYLSTAWLVFGFLGFWWFIDYIKSQTILIMEVSLFSSVLINRSHCRTFVVHFFLKQQLAAQFHLIWYSKIPLKLSQSS